MTDSGYRNGVGLGPNSSVQDLQRIVPEEDLPDGRREKSEGDVKRRSGWAKRLTACRCPSTESIQTVGSGDQRRNQRSASAEGRSPSSSSPSGNTSPSPSPNPEVSHLLQERNGLRHYGDDGGGGTTQSESGDVTPASRTEIRMAVGEAEMRSGGSGLRLGPLCHCLSPPESEDEAAAAAQVGGRGRGLLWRCREGARELGARLVAVAVSETERPSRSPLSASDGHMIAEPYQVVHTQVEYTHFLVPDLSAITAAPYYWGVMDRFEAEKLLEGKPEGSFLLRDSAQSEYLFSVSFRRYQRTLHARIEQMNHRFSFDSYDPGVFSAPSVTQLIEHYKDPTKCLFFEPQLSSPLVRPWPFSLAHLARSSVVSALRGYDHIPQLPVPKAAKDYLREYHYKQAIRVRNMES